MLTGKTIDVMPSMLVLSPLGLRTSASDGPMSASQSDKFVLLKWHNAKSPLAPGILPTWLLLMDNEPVYFGNHTA